MRRENPPAGGHDKVIWKRSRDRSRDKATRKRNCETWWRLTTATLLGVSFGSYKRRRRDILMGRRGYVPFIRLGEVTLRRRWVFYLRRTDGMSSLLLLDDNKTSWRRTSDMSWRRSTETSLGVSFETYLRRTERRCYDVVTTFYCQVGLSLKNGRTRLRQMPLHFI